MEIVLFPHPTLRYKSKPIAKVNRALKAIVDEMFELMYEARGIGLAANQVDLPLQLFIINISGEKGAGEELVFVNPVISQPKGTGSADEGCLSMPGIEAAVSRPASVHISAYDLNGNEIDFNASGLLARAIQHEFDHLNGVLFIDRISETEKKQVDFDLEEFQIEFEAKRQSGTIPPDDQILNRLKDLENEFC